jgi:hypothetical protein
MRVDEAFAEAGINSSGRRIEDSWVRARCPACHTEHRLDSAETEDSGDQTNYLCPSCGAVFVIVGPSPGLRGYNLGKHTVNALGGMEMDVPPR